MSLEGSLETVALPEVLRLLSDTSKTGELIVNGDRGEGRLRFARGKITGFDVARCDQVVDALFDLLRTENGRFSFHTRTATESPLLAHQETAEGPGEGVEVGPVLHQAQERLAQWGEILETVPSLAHVALLDPNGPEQEQGVHLDSLQWKLVVAIGEGHPVGEVLDRAGLPEFDGCRALKSLVDAGLTFVSEPVVPPRAAEESDPSDTEQASWSAKVGAEGRIDFYADPSRGAEQGRPADQVEDGPDQIGVTGTHFDARAALEALIAEIPPEEEAGWDAYQSPEHSSTPVGSVTTIPSRGEDPPDGLADRGPWTAHELASLERMGSPDTSGSEGAPGTGDAATIAKAEGPDAEGPDAGGGAEGKSEEPEPNLQPVSRGLLLKFLSSVRS